MKEDGLRIVVELMQSARDACRMNRTQRVGNGEIGALECVAESARASDERHGVFERWRFRFVPEPPSAA